MADSETDILRNKLYEKFMKLCDKNYAGSSVAKTTVDTALMVLIMYRADNMDIARVVHELVPSNYNAHLREAIYYFTLGVIVNDKTN